MTFKKYLPVFVAILMVVSMGAYAAGTIFFQQYERNLTIKVDDNELVNFTVEIAQTPIEQEKGLQKRWSLPDDAGMLFIFEALRERNFWMRDTYIPLDIIFINDSGRIDHIHHMARPRDETFITSGKPTRAVLEVNGGMTDKLGIKEGHIIYHSAFKNLNLLDK